MTQEEIRQMIEEHGYERVVLFEEPSYCTAFIGISHDERAVYDYDRMIDYLIENDGMDYDEAADFIGYNTIRALPYTEGAPIVLFTY